MPVGTMPLVGHILRRLAAAGIAEAILNLHHLPASITRAVGDGSSFGLRVRYSWEHPRVLGSAGGPRHALPLVDGDTLLVVNGDTLCDLPVRALWDRHQSSGALVTLGLMPHPAPGRYGGVTLDTWQGAADAVLPIEGVVTGFVPRTSPVPSVHFPGIQFVERDALAPLPDNEPAESVLAVYPHLMAAQPGAVRGVVFDARFDDVGTIEDYRRTCLAQAADASGNVIGAGARVAADATLQACIVWPGAEVPAGCVLERVVVTGHAALQAGASLRDAVI